MKSVNRGFALLALVLCAGLLACSRTTIKTSWVNEEYRGKPIKKVMVIGISKEPATRRLFEDDFVGELQARGTDAEPSYQNHPSAEKLEKGELISESKKSGADSLLITRLIERKTETNYYPGRVYGGRYGYYHNWYDYYSRGYGVEYDPGYIVESEIVRLETNLYDLKTEQLIWSAVSETFVDVPGKPAIKSVIRTLAKKMEKDGLVAAPKE